MSLGLTTSMILVLQQRENTNRINLLKAASNFVEKLPRGLATM